MSQSTLPTTDSPDAAGGQSAILWRPWAIRAGVVLGLVAIGHIPVPPWVITEGKLRVPDNGNYRQSVYANDVGKLVRVYVQSGDSVRVGDPLVELDFPEIDRTITGLKTEMTKQEVALQDARSRYQAAQRRIDELKTQRLIASTRLDRSRLRANHHQAPEVGVYQAELQALRAEKAGLRNRMQYTQKRMGITAQDVAKYEEAFREGVISEVRLNEKRNELLRHQEDWSSYRDQIQEIDRKMLAPQSKAAIARQSLSDESIDQADELQKIQVALASAIAETQTSQEAIARHQRVMDRYRQEHDRLVQHRDKHRLIRATRDGRVDGEDLASKLNSQVDSTDKLLEIVNLQTLEAPVEIDQFDRDVVRTGMRAKIRAPQLNQPEQEAQLEADESMVRQDATQQKRQLLYFAKVNNQNGSLRQGEKVYVTVVTEPMPLYRVLGREIQRLFKLRQFF